MSLLVESGSLPEDDRGRLDEIVQRFRAGWRPVSFSELAVLFRKFLPDGDDRLSLLTLYEFIAIDLDRRWAGGQSALLEQYSAALPSGLTTAWSSGLIAFEYQLRHKYGDRIGLDAYRDRFPDQYDTVRAILNQTTPDQPGTLDAARFSGTAVPPPPTTPAITRRSSIVPLVGEYTLFERIGSGQAGDVWRAEAPGQVEVAIKKLKCDAGRALTDMERRSLELMKRLRHAFLLQTQAYWQQDDDLYIVMELADGSLDQRQKECVAEGQQGIPSHELIRYMREAGEAIDFLHSQSVIHRDIKPANILLVKGHVKVADFGIARLVGDQASVTGTTTGTPDFMPPEVWKSKVNKHGDQYSLAATYVELRLGRPLFKVTNMYDAMQNHLLRTPDLSELPKPERTVLLKALAKEPEARYGSCTAFVDALGKAIELESAPAVRQTSSIWSGLAAVLVVCLLSAVVAAMLIQYLLRPPANQPLTVEPEPLRIFAPGELQLQAGSTQSLSVVLEPVDDGTPSWKFTESAGVRLGPPDEYIRDRKQNLRLPLTVDLNANPGPRDLVLTATLDGESAPHKLKLDILPPDVYLPSGFERALGAPHKLVPEEGGRVYYERIVPEHRRDVVFQYVPRTHSSDPSTFYMMVDMVTNRLFAAFLQANPDYKPISETWREGPDVVPRVPAEQHPELPALRVFPSDADACVRWLTGGSGSLPTLEQWLKSTGYFDDYKRADQATREARLGPFIRADQVTINQPKLGPTAVGSAPGDVSTFGIRDLAGNAREWARDERNSNDDFYLMLGMSWSDEQPFQFREYEKFIKSGGLDAGHYDDPKNLPPDDVGFRAVLKTFD